MREYGIRFLSRPSESQWAGYSVIFKTISDIKKRSYDDYDPSKETLQLGSTGMPVEWEIRKRAKLLADQARYRRAEFANEMTWRLKTEVIVLARFQAEVAWLIFIHL